METGLKDIAGKDIKLGDNILWLKSRYQTAAFQPIKARVVKVLIGESGLESFWIECDSIRKRVYNPATGYSEYKYGKGLKKFSKGSVSINRIVIV